MIKLCELCVCKHNQDKILALFAVKKNAKKIPPNIEGIFYIIDFLFD